MDIREISEKFAAATQGMSAQERQLLMQAFERVTKEMEAEKKAGVAQTVTDDGIPDGMTDRLKRLKANYMKQVPSITTYRARIITKITEENPGMPKAMLRAKSFRMCCETAPLLIQDDELIVGASMRCAACRRILLQILPGDGWSRKLTPSAPVRRIHSIFLMKTNAVMREELFPFWKGKSLDEHCEDQFREAGVWELSGESVRIRLLLSRS